MNGKDIGGLAKAAQSTYRLIGEAGRRLHGNSDEFREGVSAYLVVSAADGEEFLSLLLGRKEGDRARIARLGTSAREKSRRLAIRFRENGEYASWQSRDDMSGQYGGAVVLPVGGTEYIFSVCGLTEEADEAVAMLIAERFAPGERPLAERCFDILERTGNTVFGMLHDEIAEVGEAAYA